MPFDTLPPSQTVPSTEPAPFGLAMTAFATLSMRFDKWGHVPSNAQWAAIRDLLEHLERVANNHAEHAVYLSAIPAGTGKSASLIAFAEALMDSVPHRHVGMLVAVNRVAEVFDFAKELQPYRDRVCVIIGSDRAIIEDEGVTRDVRLMGAHQEANAAQLVITTQAALKASLKAAKRATGSDDFSHLDRYHFRGQRRQVVTWDEAVSFNRPVAINTYQTGAIANAVSRQSAEAANELYAWLGSVGKAPQGLIDVPDFTAYGVNFSRLEEDVGHDDEQAAQAHALSVLSGGKAFVVKDKSSAMVSYVPELPDSVLPLTVTDASAAVGVRHGAYEQMAKTKRIIRLKEAPKTYCNLTIRIVPTAASRSVYRDRTKKDGRKLIEMAVNYVRSVAPDDVLIISYKARSPWIMKGVKERSIQEAIEARLTAEEQKRVSHLTWGNTTATNKFTRVRHVLLMGLNFLPRPVAYATSGATQDKPMNTSDPADHPTEDDVEDVRVGLLRDSTLQGILRGNARVGVSGDCGVMEVVVPQTKQTGLKVADWLGMFPGAELREDRTLLPMKPLKGNLRRVQQFVEARQQAGFREIANPDIYANLGIDRRDFGKLVKDPRWGAWCQANGWAPGRLKGNVSGLRLAA